MSQLSAPALRPIDLADQAAVLALNNAHAVELSWLDAAGLVALLSHAALALASGPVGAPHAFLLAFDHSTPQQGPNHAWFLARHSHFLYVDRVCVVPSARGKGLARGLYEAAFRQARDRGISRVCCEVNTAPPNPGSDAFHAALGFVEVGRRTLVERAKSVRYLERDSLGFQSVGAEA